MSGTAGSFRLDVLDAGGQIIPPQVTANIGAFQLYEWTDAAPAGAAALRVVNNSATSARIAAYAVVVNPSTGDAWPLEDSTVFRNFAPETFYIPVAAPSGAVTTVYAFNRSGAVANLFTFDTVSGRKRRAVSSTSSASASDVPTVVATLSTSTVPPQATTSVDVSGIDSGYVRVRGPAGSMCVTARTVVPAGSKPVPYGDALPVVPAQDALSLGRVQRISGIDDTESVHSSLMLIETSGFDVQVRVTLTYSFAAATKSTAYGTTSRDYVLPAAAFVNVRDVVTSVLGSDRALFGDIYGIQADIEPVAGKGSVIASLVTTDARSGDVAIRRR